MTLNRALNKIEKNTIYGIINEYMENGFDKVELGKAIIGTISRIKREVYVSKLLNYENPNYKIINEFKKRFLKSLTILLSEKEKVLETTLLDIEQMYNQLEEKVKYFSQENKNESIELMLYNILQNTINNTRKKRNINESEVLGKIVDAFLRGSERYVNQTLKNKKRVNLGYRFKEYNLIVEELSKIYKEINQQNL